MPCKQITVGPTGDHTIKEDESLEWLKYLEGRGGGLKTGSNVR